jgi:subtilisin family serine protease
MRLLLSAALAGTVLAAWVGFERARGPSAGPIPAALPYCVHRPPPLRAAFPAAETVSNPGEEVRRLHARGVTGRRIGIAIIDRPLLTEHREFADRLRWYDEIDTVPGEPAGWHSTAVASITAGRTVGVAPEADLYFVGLGMNWAREPLGNLFVAVRRAAHTGMPLPLAIRRILEMNRRLEPGRKIRAISISIGGYGGDAVAEARAAGIFISNIDLRLAPIGPVTIASPAGPESYTTHKRPAGSWAIAWWAGRYALACQEDPSMTPERFVKLIPASARER